MHRASDDFLK